MANVFNTLSLNNPYRDIIIPLVQAYGISGAMPTNMRPNPHEVWLAASLLTLRTGTWGENLPEGDGPVRGNTTGGGGGISNDKCCKLKNCTCNTTAARGAQADGPGAASPNTTLVQTLEEQLRTIDMSQPNAWIDWNEAVKFFYEGVGPFLEYFRYSYKNGAYTSLYEDAIGAFRHPDSYQSGLDMTLIQAGSDGPDKATTTITVDIALVGDTDTYFIVHSDAANRTIIWFDVDGSGSGGPVIPPIAGVSDQYIKVDLDSAQPPADSALSVRNQLAVAVGWAFEAPTTGGVSDVIITTLTTGSKPASSFNLPAHDTWGGVFVDGDDDASAKPRIDCWGTWCAPAEVMADRFVMIYDILGASWLFYWNLDGAGTFTPPVGLIPDNTIAINVTTGETPEEVAILTAAALDSSGVVSTSIAEGTLISLTYLINGAVQDFDQGTGGIGINYTYSDELRASDASVLATGITSDEEYIENWNTLRVPYEANLGFTYPYLTKGALGLGDPIGVQSAGSPCGVCVRARGKAHWSGSGGTITGQISCKGCNTTASAGLLMAVPYPTTGTYNTPGNIFIAADGRQANMIEISEIV